MAASELDSLIVRNLGDIDKTAQRLEIVQERVFGALDGMAKGWALDAQWDGVFDLYRTELWVAAFEWRSDAERDAWYAWFNFEQGVGDTAKQARGEDYFWLTRLCGAGQGCCGFRLHQQDLVSKPEWKKLVRVEAVQFQKLGFIIDEKGSPFMEVVIDAKILAAGLEEDDLENASAPFTAALKRLEAAKTLVNSLLTRAGNRKGAKA